MKYINQLTDDELKDLFLRLVQNCYGVVNIDERFRCEHNDFLVFFKGAYISRVIRGIRCSSPINVVLDDYHVYDTNRDLIADDSFIKDYRKYMFARFGEQYAIDCFLNDCEGDY